MRNSRHCLRIQRLVLLVSRQCVGHALGTWYWNGLHLAKGSQRSEDRRIKSVSTCVDCTKGAPHALLMPKPALQLRRQKEDNMRFSSLQLQECCFTVKPCHPLPTAHAPSLNLLPHCSCSWIDASKTKMLTKYLDNAVRLWPGKPVNKNWLPIANKLS